VPTVPVSLRALEPARPAAALAVPTRPMVDPPAREPLEERPPTLDERTASLLAGLGVDPRPHLARERAKGEPGEVVAVPMPAPKEGDGLEVVLLVGTGDGSPASLRRAGAALARKARTVSSLRSLVAVDADSAGARAHGEGLVLGSYRFSLASRPYLPELRWVEVAVDDPGAVSDAFDRGVATAQAVELARNLVNTPGLEGDPAWLGLQAEYALVGHGVDVDIAEPELLESEGFGGLLAVGGGSSRGPRLVQLTWSPPEATRHVVLVGKGITFDTGGLSLKKNEGMVTMKTDMAGAAAVLGTMKALTKLRLPVKVTGLLAAAENMPSGSAYRPGDVITQWGGTTVEVLNTDAEGRLVLADTLAWAAAYHSPDVMVDVATLTGAMPVALGTRTAGLFATDDGLAEQLLAAGASSGEQVWRMPLVEDYRDALDSPVADLRNIGDPDRHYSGGGITAALFLREFTGGLPWAHLDIAGPARAKTEPAREPEITKGGTGYGVRLLVAWLEALAEDG
jgi:leucyl aminopeptidase